MDNINFTQCTGEGERTSTPSVKGWGRAMAGWKNYALPRECMGIHPYQGGSRLSEFRKIPEEIFRKSVTKSGLLKFQWLFTKKYKNQWQKGDFWNLSDIFSDILKNLESQRLFSVTFWKVPVEVKHPTSPLKILNIMAVVTKKCYYSNDIDLFLH